MGASIIHLVDTATADLLVSCLTSFILLSTIELISSGLNRLASPRYSTSMIGLPPSLITLNGHV